MIKTFTHKELARFEKKYPTVKAFDPEPFIPARSPINWITKVMCGRCGRQLIISAGLSVHPKICQRRDCLDVAMRKQGGAL